MIANSRCQFCFSKNKYFFPDLTSETKLLKDFYTLVKNKPIQIKCGCNTTVGMNLIPMFMSICVSYAIVVLQFSQLKNQWCLKDVVVVKKCFMCELHYL